jgi:LPS export ABC transporter permease LptG
MMRHSEKPVNRRSRILPLRIFAYLFREIVPFYIISVLSLTFIIFSQQLPRYLNLINLDASALLNARLMITLLPSILIITLPFSAVFSTLLVINKLLSDHENTGISACGLSPLTTGLPFIFSGCLTGIATFLLTTSLAPASLKSLQALRIEAIKYALTLKIQPQILNNTFKDHLILVQRISQQTGDWQGILIVRPTSETDLLTVSATRGRVQFLQSSLPGSEDSIGLELEDGITLTSQKDNLRPQKITRFKKLVIRLSDTNLPVPMPEEFRKSIQELSFTQLASQIKRLPPDSLEYRQASTEWHKRLALPTGAVLLVLLIIPIGNRLSTHSGRGFNIIVGLVIAAAYYFISIAGQNLSLTGAVKPLPGVWAANLTALLTALVITGRAVRASSISGLNLITPLKRLLPEGNHTTKEPRTDRFGRLIDSVSYLISSEFIRFTIPAVLILLALAIIFTLFDLVPSIARNRIGENYVLGYLGYLTPQLTYQLIPFGMLFGLLLTFGILARSNQIVALSAHGLSPMQIALPVIAITLLFGLIQFTLSESILPATNRNQDERYNIIKGRKTEQTVVAFNKKWVYDTDQTLFCFDHINSDNQLLNATAYQFEPSGHTVCQVVHADKSEQTGDKTWKAMEGVWKEVICPRQDDSESGDFKGTGMYSSEGAALFRKPVNESSKMNLEELSSQINRMRNSGSPAAELIVDYERKKAYPLFGLILVILALPFCLTFTSGTMVAKLNLCLLLSLMFWTGSLALEALGKKELLPSALSVWGAPTAFGALGIYLFFRVRK